MVRFKNELSCRLRLKCDGTRVETRFRLSAKRTSLVKSAGASVQSTTGSRGVRISGSNAGYTMFWGSMKGTGYPLHSPVSPSLPLPCVTACLHFYSNSTLSVCFHGCGNGSCYLYLYHAGWSVVNVVLSAYFRPTIGLTHDARNFGQSSDFAGIAALNASSISFRFSSSQIPENFHWTVMWYRILTDAQVVSLV